MSHVRIIGGHSAFQGRMLERFRIPPCGWSSPSAGCRRKRLPHFLVRGAGRDEIGRQRGAFAEEIGVHLLDQELLGFLRARLRRYSFMIIFMRSTHIFQASLETFS